jgi:hypothetical protein
VNVHKKKRSQSQWRRGYAGAEDCLLDGRTHAADNGSSWAGRSGDELTSLLKFAISMHLLLEAVQLVHGLPHDCIGSCRVRRSI